MATSQRHSNPNLPLPYQRVQRPTLSSACYRLSQLYGESAHKWESRMSGPESDFARVARMIGVLRGLGMNDAVTERMVQIEHALASRVIPPLFEALSEEQLADCFEDLSEEPFREKLRKGTATVEDAQTYVKRSAAARYKAELAEVAVTQWIAEQKEAQR